jgi:hypothetical protein
MKACIVRNIDTKDLYKFTLGEQGEVIITDERKYNVRRLQVSLVPIEEVRHLDNDFYVVLKGKHG